MTAARMTALLIASLLAVPAAAEQAAPEDAGAAVTEEITVDHFFRGSLFRKPVLSPDGGSIAFLRQGTVFAGNPDTGVHKVWTVTNGHDGIEVTWISPTDLMLKTRIEASGNSDFVAFRLNVEDGSYKILERVVVKIDGYIHDPLPAEPGVVLLAEKESNDGVPYADLFRVDVFGDVYLQTRKERRINRDSNFLFYYVRHDDEFLLGMSLIDRRQQIWAPNRRGDWAVVSNLPKETSFVPIALSQDARTVWALSNAYSDTIAAVAFDLETSTMSEPLYVHERYDLVDILVSPAGDRPIAFGYVEEGQLQYRYVQGEDAPFRELFRKECPDANVDIISSSADQKSVLVTASSAQNRGDLQLCHLDRDACSLVGPVAPWLENVELGTMESMQFTSGDGLEIDAFITMPANAGDSVPLIVMPHGGPIGVSDYGYYSPHVQWLSHNGYAVLRVNYRGSAGYGRSFERAGLREWGRGIEDDIRTAMEHAFELKPALDRERACIFGSSYGGYSALMSVIRYPDAFQCAASFAGVTDLTLLFNQSSARRNRNITEQLVEMIGDPAVDHATLIRYSPVYQHRRIATPVFLAHGDSDRVVDVEHSWRLRKILHLAGSDVDFHVFPGLAHGFELTTEVKQLYDPLLAFLGEHLGESPSPSPSADDATASN